MANIRMDDRLWGMLKQYEFATGVRVAKSVDEAVERWLLTVAPVRLRALDQEPLAGLEELEAEHIKKHRVPGPEAVKERAAQPGQFQTKVVR
jgi:hypothetical protein